MIRCHFCGKTLTPETAIPREVRLNRVTGSDLFATTNVTGYVYGMADLCPSCYEDREGQDRALRLTVIIACVIGSLFVVGCAVAGFILGTSAHVR